METELTIMHLKGIITEYKKHLSENSDCIKSLNVDRIEALETAIEAINKLAEYENPKEKKSSIMSKEEILLMNRLP
jgi:hypothetical protein